MNVIVLKIDNRNSSTIENLSHQIPIVDSLPKFALNKGGGFASPLSRRAKSRHHFCFAKMMAEREGFEPSIPVSRDTRLAGERLRPGSAISPLLVL
jgi:hypothetical protein